MANPFIPVSIRIPIDFYVERYKVFKEDNLLELWGHVGDYEVCVHIPLDSLQATLIMELQ